MVVAGACIALSLWVFRRALDGYFTPDDFILLGRGQGITEWPHTLWRAVAGMGFWTFSARVFGSAPLPYHVLIWLLHGLNVGLLFIWVRRCGGTLPAAALAAGLFGVSRQFFTVVYQASAIGEELSLGFTLGALCLLESGEIGRRRWFPALLFALALFSKESVALTPLVALVVARDPGSRRVRLPAVASMLGIGLALAIYLVVTHGSIGSLGGVAYEARLGPHMVTNFFGYLEAALDVTRLAPDPAAPRWSWPGPLALTVLAALTAWRWRRSRLPAAGLAGFVLGLVPLLPLVRAQHAHYLYTPMAFLAAALGAVLWPEPSHPQDASRAADTARPLGASRPLVSRGRSPAPDSRLRTGAVAWLTVGAMVLGAVVFAEHAFGVRHRLTIPELALPFDSMLRKMAFAQRVMDDLRPGLGDEPVRIAWVLPRGEGQPYSVRTGKRVETVSGPRYDFLTAILDEGRAVRAVFPQVREVDFVEAWSHDLRDHLIVTNTTQGHITVHGRGPTGYASLNRTFIAGGLAAQARDLLEVMLAEAPDDPTLHLLHAVAGLRLGDTAQARGRLEDLARRHPRSAIGQEASDWLRRQETRH